MIELIRGDNMIPLRDLFHGRRPFDLIYADMMYDNHDFQWTNYCASLLSEDGSFFIQTNYQTVAEIKIHVESTNELHLMNWIVLPFNWGGRPLKAYGRKHDDLLWFVKDPENYKFYPERVQIPKVTAGTGFDKNNKPTQTPTDVWEGLARLSTVSNEKVGGFGYQKPEALMERIILGHSDEGDYVLDPFLGTGTTGVVASKYGRNFVGIEQDSEVFEIAKERIYNAERERSN